MRLDENQKRVAHAPDGNLLVLAGPGSGKTSTLAHRIRILRERKQSVLALSFTKKSATELRERAMVQNGDGIFVGTFHSFCYQVLKKQGRVRVVPPALKLKFFGGNRNLMRDVDRVRAGQDGGSSERRLAEAYADWLDRTGMLDFDDLLTKTKDLLGAPMFDHVIVDEAQDNNELQYDLLAKLGRNVTLIGDVDQSIYGFRGADPLLVGRFLDEFKPETLFLENNYRCAVDICRLAQRVIEADPSRFDKQTRPVQREAGLIRWKDDHDELGWLMRRVQEGGAPTVLARSNAMLGYLEENMASMLFPAHRKGGIWSKAGMQKLVAVAAQKDPLGADWEGFWRGYADRLPLDDQWEKGTALKLSQTPRSQRSEVVQRLQGDWPTLSTIHGAKGLEWEEVAVMGVRDDEFPRAGAPFEEELRLFYVAITRAKQRLHLSGDPNSAFGSMALDALLDMRFSRRAA